MTGPTRPASKLTIYLAIIGLAIAILACQAVNAIPVIGSWLEDDSTAGPNNSPAAIAPLSQQQQKRIFEQLWGIIDAEYLYADFNGLDWDGVYAEYSDRITAGLTSEAFYQAMDEMVWRLGDDHSVYLDPQQAADEDAIYSGDYSYVGIGVQLQPVPERQRAVILLVFAGSPAEQAGLQSRDSILLSNGEPVLDQDGSLRRLSEGPEGTRLVLTVQSPGEPPRQVELQTSSIQGQLPLPHRILISPSGHKVGYLLLPSFSEARISQEVKAILTLFGDEHIEALIIDNRINEGGVDQVMIATLRYFTQGPVGFFVNRTGQEAVQIDKPTPIGNSLALPLVVLVGPGTYSFGEVFAGILQDKERAYLIGETTEGNVETLYGYDFEDGSRAWIAHDSFRPANNPDQDWETSGIVPDLTVPAAWDLHPLEQDPAVQAALTYLDAVR